MNQLTDIELLKRVESGDQRAFGELFDRYFTPLTVYADKMLQDKDEATDIVQSLFVSVYENRQGLEVQNVRSFLFQSTHNRCLNHIKHQNVHTQFASHALNTADIESNAIEEAIEASELEARLAAALNQLPAQCKHIFEMSRVDGLTNAEIAEQLGLSKRTVETQISNALKQLRHILGYNMALLILCSYI